MRARLVLVCALVAAPAAAAPAADVVIVWTAQPSAPTTTAIGDAARRAGAAVIDASPSASSRPDARPLVQRGIDAYDALDFDAALTALDAAAELVDHSGGAGLDAVGLGDLFLYRGMARVQRGDDARAWDDFLVAAGIDPARILDPARFPPRAVEQHARARAEVATRARGRVDFTPPGCHIVLDGVAVSADTAELGFGRHWVRAECEGHVPAGRPLELDRPVISVEVAGAAIDPPTDDELAIQGRTAGARAIVVVTIRAGVAIVRRLGIDGRELDRTSVEVTGDRDPRRVADAVTAMLVPPVIQSHHHWYRSRWVWAAAGAVVASAILVPFAVSGGGAPPVVIRPTGVPSW